MEYLNGTYTWHYISNDEKVVGVLYGCESSIWKICKKTESSLE